MDTEDFKTILNSLSYLFSNLCIEGIDDLLYLSVFELFTINLSWFLFCITCNDFLTDFLNWESFKPFFANLLKCHWHCTFCRQKHSCFIVCVCIWFWHAKYLKWIKVLWLSFIWRGLVSDAQKLQKIIFWHFPSFGWVRHLICVIHLALHGFWLDVLLRKISHKI